MELAEVEVNFTADYLDCIAEWARRIKGEIVTSDRPGKSIFPLRQAIGVVGGILPWNFPFLLIVRNLASDQTGAWMRDAPVSLRRAGEPSDAKPARFRRW